MSQATRDGTRASRGSWHGDDSRSCRREKEEGVEEEEEELLSVVLGDREEVHAPSGEEEVLAWGGVRHVG